MYEKPHFYASPLSKPFSTQESARFLSRPMTAVPNQTMTSTSVDLREAFMKSFDTSRDNDCIINFAANFFGPQPGENGYDEWQSLIAQGDYNPNHVKPALQKKLAKFQASLFDKMADIERRATIELLDQLTDDEILDWKRCIDQPSAAKTS